MSPLPAGRQASGVQGFIQLDSIILSSLRDLEGTFLYFASANNPKDRKKGLRKYTVQVLNGKGLLLLQNSRADYYLDESINPSIALI